MLAVEGRTLDSYLLGRQTDYDEPIDFARDASVVFARLPSGYCKPA